MTIEDMLIAAAFEGRDGLNVLTCRIATDIVVIHEVGGCGDEEGCRGCIADRDTLLAIDDLTIREHLQTTFRVETSGHTLMFYTFDEGSQLMPIDLARGFQLAVETDIEGQNTLLTGLDPHDNRIVGLRGKARATIGHTVEGILGGGKRCSKIQLSTIAAGVMITMESQFYTTYWQKAHTMRPLDEMLVDQGAGLLLFTFEDQLAHLLQILLRLCTIIIIR